MYVGRGGEGREARRGCERVFFAKTKKFVCLRIIELQPALDKVRIIYNAAGLHYHRR